MFAYVKVAQAIENHNNAHRAMHGSLFAGDYMSSVGTLSEQLAARYGWKAVDRGWELVRFRAAKYSE